MQPLIDNIFYPIFYFPIQTPKPVNLVLFFLQQNHLFDPYHIISTNIIKLLILFMEKKHAVKYKKEKEKKERRDVGDRRKKRDMEKRLEESVK
jgi:hypothetical protein